MRFGGHETFPVREGWLHKGMQIIAAEPEAFHDPLVADRLGVGRNMAKSIRHWLLATMLAKAERSQTDPKRRKLVATEIGEAVLANDPYFLRLGTWCALHLNLLNHADYARTWAWFFSRYTEQRFDRLGCVAALERHVERNEAKGAATKTLQRDLSCLLATYARPIPSEQVDPEDAWDSPFRRLGLLSHYRNSNTYRRNAAETDQLGAELLGYGLAACGVGGGSVPVRDACFCEGGPGRALHLDLDEFMGFVEHAEQSLTGAPIRLIGSAGERRIRVQALPPHEWLNRYYARVTARSAA